jgi:purine-binding chemotaxis protein CheW
MQYVTFMLDGIEFAVDVNVVETVVEYRGATQVPSAHDFVRGVMDLRGRTVAVVDLRRKFGLAPADAPRDSSVVVLSNLTGFSTGNVTIGALVDGVSEVVDIEDHEVAKDEATRAPLWRPFVQGIAKKDGRALVLIDSRGIFSLEELADAGSVPGASLRIPDRGCDNSPAARGAVCRNPRLPSSAAIPTTRSACTPR